MTRRLLASLTLVTALTTALVPTALLAETVGEAKGVGPGMWLPLQLPEIAADLRASGLQLDPAQLGDLTGFPMGAIVSLKGCSASFVSPDGLVATNHHCVFGALQYNSTPERDLIENGFLARTRAEEVQASPEARVIVITGIEDVTAKVLPAAEAKLADGERYRRVERHRRELVAACEKNGESRCQVRGFFGGESYLLFRTMEIQDVRLVYAPALGVGNFGDEDDNWMWPRQTGDFGFYRAYVGKDGKPAPFSPENVPYRPKHFLKVSTRDIDPGDFMAVVGFPGKTERLATASELAEAESFDLPTSVRYRKAVLAALHAAGANDKAVAIKNASRIASLENYLKNHESKLVAMQRDGLVERKRAGEVAARQAVAGQPGGEVQWDAAMAELDRVFALQRATRERDTVLSWLGQSSPMLAQSEKLVKNAIERAKKDDLDRDSEYQDRDRLDLASSIQRAQRQIEPASDRAGLRIVLLESQALPANQRVEPLDRLIGGAAGNGGDTAEAKVDAFLDRLYAGTRVGELDLRKSMLQMTPAQLAAAGDSMIDLALALKPFRDSIQEQADGFEGSLLRARPAYVAAQRLARGGPLAPDANGSLRVIFGKVEGYSPQDGLVAVPQTTIGGIVAKDTGVRPFDSPKALLEAADAGNFGGWVDPELGTLPVNFLTTNSVTGGSSGSATLNAWGEVAGLAFDTNIEAVAADYVYDPKWTRTIHVDSRYMLWVMETVDHATELLQELGVVPAVAPAGAAVGASGH